MELNDVKNEKVRLGTDCSQEMYYAKTVGSFGKCDAYSASDIIPGLL